MNKRILLLLTVSLISLVLHAQELQVKEMKATNDLSASQYKRKDLAGEACALVKVQLATADVVFEGNVIQPVEYKGGEYWVYMSKGSRELRIKHLAKSPAFVPCHVSFSDYGIRNLESLTTYNLTLLLPQGAATEQTQKLTINYSPADAMVLVDSKLYKGNGRVEVLLPIGNHNYIIAAEGYESAEGSVKLTAASPRTITEELSMSKQHNSVTPTNIQKPIDNDQSITEKLNNTQQQTTNQDVLEDFVSKMCGIYNIELSKTSMSEIETLYGVKQKKGKEHYEICIKDDTEFKDIMDNGKCNLITIDPQKTNEVFPSIDNMSWRSSYKEWNQWFASHGFEEKPYEPYYQKQAMLVYRKGALNVILMFSGKETSHGTWFALIISYEPKQ